jgi:threonine/homoserine/homoserine lactone efflux protein
MVDIILKAIIIGITLSFLIGPVFFLLLDFSINKGVKTALRFDIGVILSDILWIFIINLGVYEYFQNIISEQILTLIGGIIFISFGVLKYLNRKKTVAFEGLNKKENLYPMTKGFTINSINPAVPVFWLGVLSIFETSFNQHSVYLTTIFFGVIVATMFAIDLLKIFSALKIKKYLSESFMIKLNIILGMVFCFVGLSLIYKSI